VNKLFKIYISPNGKAYISPCGTLSRPEMAETFQPQIPKEINQLVEYLEELGFKFKFNPTYREIIIKGQIDDVFGDGHLFSIAIRQGLFKRIFIRRYPRIIEVVVSGMNKEFKSESKEIELYFNLEARYEDGHLHIEYFPYYFDQYIRYYPEFDRVDARKEECRQTEEKPDEGGERE
jgi:hypothetical protein